MPSLEETFALASQHHAAGNLPLAEHLYRQVIQAAPHAAQVHSCLGVALVQQGKLELAVASLQQALRCRPDYPEAHNDLANVWQALGRLDEAVEHYRHALRLRPNYPEAHNNLAVVLVKQRKFDEAVAHYQEAVRQRPNYAGAYFNLGGVLQLQDKLDEAIACYRRALNFEPRFADACNNLGIALDKKGLEGEAILSFRRALDCRPQYAEAHSNLAGVLTKQGDHTGAIEHCQQALRLEPALANAHVNMAIALHRCGRLEEAVVHFREGLRLDPLNVSAHTNLGITLMDQDHLEEAAACHQRALEINPQSANAHLYLGVAYERQGRCQEALDCYRQALALEPRLEQAQVNLMQLMNYDPDLDHDKVFAEHLRWGRLVQPASPPRPHNNERSFERRLRVGYVSPWFCFDAVTRYFEPVLTNHDRQQVEVFCYAGVPVEDAVSARLRNAAENWRSIWGLSDTQAAELIRADGIDILVDLAGHTPCNRLGVFALKPAPVQATCLSYLNTTGLTAIDYRLTDAILDPPGQPVLDTEELVRLSTGMCCFAPPEDAPEVGPLPAQRRGFVTFGSLNRLVKLNDKVYDVWSQVLRALPMARLLIFRSELTAAAQERITGEFDKRWIPSQRLVLLTGSRAQGYLSIYNDIDVLLDTFPCTGGVTTCEALWMGVPVLSLCGTRPMARNSASLLTRAGLADWVVHTPQEYVARAARVPQELDQLADLRQQLREQMRQTLCDGPRFTRVLEEAYRTMWRRWAGREEETRRQGDKETWSGVH